MVLATLGCQCSLPCPAPVTLPGAAHRGLVRKGRVIGGQATLTERLHPQGSEHDTRLLPSLKTSLRTSSPCPVGQPCHCRQHTREESSWLSQQSLRSYASPLGGRRWTRPSWLPGPPPLLSTATHLLPRHPEPGWVPVVLGCAPGHPAFQPSPSSWAGGRGGQGEHWWPHSPLPAHRDRLWGSGECLQVRAHTAPPGAL